MSLLFKKEDFESLDWKDHPVFKNGLQTKHFFNNGYGISIITNKSNSGSATNILNSFEKAYGSQDKGTFEIGVLKGNRAKHEFVSIEELKNVDPDYIQYEDYGGIWTDCNVEKVIEKINLIATL
jgi:hypothetical protein